MYMAPEVAHDHPYNEKADVFSFGMMGEQQPFRHCGVDIDPCLLYFSHLSVVMHLIHTIFPHLHSVHELLSRQLLTSGMKGVDHSEAAAHLYKVVDVQLSVSRCTSNQLLLSLVCKWKSNVIGMEFGLVKAMLVLPPFIGGLAALETHPRLHPPALHRWLGSTGDPPPPPSSCPS